MAMGRFSVTKMAPALVVPSEPTPSGNLPLSFIDHALENMVPMLHVYGHGGQEPARRIREALAKALVPYYPVAGRIVSADGALHVACTGEGVVFVEASAECSLEDVGYLDREPLVIPTDQLLPTLPPGTHHDDDKDLILVMQVTQFKCGGFSVGAAFHHTVFDGAGAGQFFVALGELCRGLAEPRIKPVWHREAVSSMLKHPTGHHTPAAVEQAKLDYELHYMDVPLDVINRTKEHFFEEANQTCSVLDVVIAMVWQCRTRAIGRVEEGELLVIIADARQYLYLRDDGFRGYYGNCIMPLLFEAQINIANASLVEIVKLIKQGKSTLQTQAEQYLEEEPATAEWAYSVLVATDWRRLGFYETDYGWGKPTNVVELDVRSEPTGFVTLLNPPAPKKGVRLRLRCVVKEHLKAFLEEMSKYMHV